MLPIWYIYFAYQEYKVQERAKLSIPGGKVPTIDITEDSPKKLDPARKSKTPEPFPPKSPEVKRPATPKSPTPEPPKSPKALTPEPTIKRTETPKSPTPEPPKLSTLTKSITPEPIKSPSPSRMPDPPNISDIPKSLQEKIIQPSPKSPEPIKSIHTSTPYPTPIKSQSEISSELIEAPEFPGYKISKEDPMKKITSSLISSKPLLIPTPECSDDEEIIADIEEELSDVEEEEELDDFRKPTSKMVDAAVLEKLEAGFKKLEESDSKSLLKKYLTRDVFEKLKNLKTPSFGSTLLDVIQSGLENHDSGVGIYAPDAEAYTVFSDLFDPIIEDYHGGFKKTDKHPNKDWGDVDSMGNLDPAGEFIISTRVRCGRSLEGYPFNPCLTEAQYKEMEDKVSSTLQGMEGELKGTYYPLTGMTKEVQQKLIDDHFLFKEGDRFLQAANACRFWPTGRGIYHNDSKTFLVWSNEEDHLRIISMQMGGDLGQVYRRLVSAVNEIEKRVPFSHNERLGFLTFCPTNLGTTVRASVHIKVPKLAANKAKLEEIAGKFNLQVRGTRGEHTEAEGGVYDISNKRRMGLTEYEAVKEMNDGIAELIKIEKEL